MNKKIHKNSLNQARGWRKKKKKKKGKARRIVAVPIDTYSETDLMDHVVVVVVVVVVIVVLA
jgi:hypothetical protein